MRIRWFGHASFLIESKGLRIVTDPFDRSVGYPIPKVETDVVLVSHAHFDHNAVELVGGKPRVIDKEGESMVGDLVFTGIPSFHDDTQGSQRGKNVIFAFELDGVRLCHLGDLGHRLSQAQLNSIGPVDILFIPVGGNFTIDGDQATGVVEQLNPRLVIPMHFKTPLCSIPIDGADKFLAGKELVRRAKTLDITKEKLPTKTEIVVLDYEQ